MDSADPPWAVPLTVADIADEGQHIELEADAAARERIAPLAGLRCLDRLSASFDLMRSGESVKVSGQVTARVGQTCVVSLEPMENDITETVDLIFSPAASEKEAPATRMGHADEKEPHEPLVGGVIDLGKLATEFLVLAVDPYPRRPGAEFHAPQPDSDPQSHPFAALGALKKH
jgi:hypothetical protein